MPNLGVEWIDAEVTDFPIQSPVELTRTGTIEKPKELTMPDHPPEGAPVRFRTPTTIPTKRGIAGGSRAADGRVEMIEAEMIETEMIETDMTRSHVRSPGGRTSADSPMSYPREKGDCV